MSLVQDQFFFKAISTRNIILENWIFLYSKFVSTLDVFWNSFISAILTCADKIHIFIKVDYIIFLVCLYIIINMLKIKKFKKKMKIAEKITGLGIKDINVYLTFHIITIFFFTSDVSKIILTWKRLVMCHVYLVNIPKGKASFLTNPVVKFGSLFFLLPVEIRCWRHSKNTCGAWKTKGSGLPVQIKMF